MNIYYYAVVIRPRGELTLESGTCFGLPDYMDAIVTEENLTLRISPGYRDKVVAYVTKGDVVLGYSVISTEPISPRLMAETRLKAMSNIRHQKSRLKEEMNHLDKALEKLASIPRTAPEIAYDILSLFLKGECVHVGKMGYAQIERLGGLKEQSLNNSFRKEIITEFEAQLNTLRQNLVNTFGKEN